MAKLEAEVNLLRRRISNLEEEIARIKKENINFANELGKARAVSQKHDFYCNRKFVNCLRNSGVVVW